MKACNFIVHKQLANSCLRNGVVVSHLQAAWLSNSPQLMSKCY